ncbi:MAG: hypothetical protein KBC69_01055 [Candidatus Magasanikbacteria bacterium]|nr:hypothetical protein [Candidatus Magasanikbacteria bacterium]
MNNKKILSAALVVVIVGVVVYLFTTQGFKEQESSPVNTDANSATTENGRLMAPSTTEEEPVGKLKVANFSGKLQKVDTGCFADGECYVEVDGKHVTAIMGWSQAVVGSVQGVEGFGDLESHIGQDVEVYAQDKGDGTYTLYGNAGFYIKLK